ncbi:hypothetical protein ACFX1Z_018678 [Malus domestica]
MVYWSHWRFNTVILQKFDHIIVFVINCICKRCAAPTITQVDLGASLEQELDNIGLALASGDVKGGAAVDVSEISIGAGVDELLDGVQVALLLIAAVAMSWIPCVENDNWNWV